MDQHVLLQIRLLCELLEALGASVLLPSVVDLFDVAAEGILGAEDELAIHTVKLLRLLVYLQQPN